MGTQKIIKSEFSSSELYVCNHRHGMNASFVASTDTYGDGDTGNDFWASELYCFRENVHFTYMVKPFSFDNNNGIDYTNRDKYQAQQTGRLDHGIYYYGRGFNHDQGTSISKEEMQAVVKNQMEAFMYHFRRYPSVFAYAVAFPDRWREHTPWMLANRVASGLTSWTDYDMYGFDTVSGAVLGTRPSPAYDTYLQTHSQQMRWPTTGEDPADFAATFTANGMYNYFHHLYSSADMDAQISAIRTELDLHSNIWRGSLLDAVEYKYYRDQIDHIAAAEYDDDLESGVVIQMVLSDKYGSFLYPHMINTPISVFIDLTGTALAGGNVRLQNGLGNLGIRSLGSDQYVVDLPNPHIKEGVVSFKLVADSSANYYDFTAPTISSQVVASGNVTVTTNIPTRAAMFKVPGTATTDQRSATLWKRSNTLSTTHVFPVNTGEYYYCGVITPMGESILGSIISPA